MFIEDRFKNLTQFQRTIGQFYKLQLKSMMYLPKATYTSVDTKTLIMDNNSVVLMLYIDSADVPWKDRFFMIFEKGQGDFIRCLDEVISWFRDPDKKDLFFVDDNGVLIYNTAYRDLVVQIKEKRKDAKILQIRPSLVVDSLNNREEGISIMIQNSYSETRITFDELLSLRDIIDRFSYQMESVRLIQEYQFARMENRFVELNANGIRVNPFFTDSTK